MCILLYRVPYQQFYSLSYSFRSFQCSFPCTLTFKQVWSMSYSSRNLQCTIPCTVHLIKRSSQCPIPPEVFSAYFPVHRTLSAGLVTVVFLQKYLMHNLLFRVPFQPVLCLSYSSRTLEGPFTCVQRPINMSSPCPIPPDVFKPHFPV